MFTKVFLPIYIALGITVHRFGVGYCRSRNTNLGFELTDGHKKTLNFCSCHTITVLRFKILVQNSE
jgi:hypothetical protein